jgi:hypothetical protein
LGDRAHPSRTLRERAESILRRAAGGEALPRDEVEALAREWLAAVGAKAALDVLTGGDVKAGRAEVRDVHDALRRLAREGIVELRPW